MYSREVFFCHGVQTEKSRKGLKIFICHEEDVVICVSLRCCKSRKVSGFCFHAWQNTEFFVSEKFNQNIYLRKSEALLKVTIIVCTLFVDCFTAWW